MPTNPCDAFRRQLMSPNILGLPFHAAAAAAVVVVLLFTQGYEVRVMDLHVQQTVYSLVAVW